MAQNNVSSRQAIDALNAALTYALRNNARYLPNGFTSSLDALVRHTMIAFQAEVVVAL